MPERWQRYWEWLFYVLLAVSTGGAVAGLDSGARRAAVLLLAAGLALWYWHEVIRSGRALGARPGRLPSLAVAAVLWAPLLLLQPLFQLLVFSAYQLACSAPAPVRRALPAIAAVGALAVTTTSVRAGFDPLALVFYGAVTLALSLFVAMTRAMHEQSEHRRKLIAELEATRTELAESERRAGTLGERQRLAGEIHDTLAQGFASIVTLCEAARAESGSRPDLALRRLEEVGRTARSSLDEARRAVWALRPEALERRSLGRALGELAAGFRSETGIDAHGVISGEQRKLLPGAEIALLRVAQEALANVRQHARAQRVGLTLTYLDDATLLDVRDNGVGFDPELAGRARDRSRGAGFGLTGMRERVEGQGGTLTVESAPGRGTAVVAALPAAVQARRGGQAPEVR